MSSKPERFREFASYYIEDLNKSLDSLGVQSNAKVKSLLLGIALSSKQPEQFIQSMPHVFSADINQSLNAALLSGDENLLANALSEFLITAQGNSFAVTQGKVLSQKIFDSLKNK